eukprot:1368038-Pyramimonas_sp.AAC.1
MRCTLQRAVSAAAARNLHPRTTSATSEFTLLKSHQNMLFNSDGLSASGSVVSGCGLLCFHYLAMLFNAEGSVLSHFS